MRLFLVINGSITEFLLYFGAAAASVGRQKRERPAVDLLANEWKCVDCYIQFSTADTLELHNDGQDDNGSMRL